MARWAALVSLLATLLAVAPGGATASLQEPARAAPTPPARPALLGLAAQAGPAELAASVQRLAAREGLDGFVGTVLAGDGTVLLYWHGQVPQAVRRLAEQPGGIEVRPAAYSRETLDREARRLLATSGGRVVAAAPLADFSGLEVALAPTAAGQAPPRVASTVRTVLRARTAAVALSRFSSSPPFRAGSAIRSPGHMYCTSGFAARRANGEEVLLTARHCGPNRQWVSPESGRVVGWSDTGDGSVDAMAISGADYEPLTFTGPWSSSRSVPVTRAATPSIGALVCTSGAFSGQVCGNQVVRVNAYELLGGQVVGPGAIIEQVDRAPAAGQGDSGGPVYSLRGGSAVAHGAIDLGYLDTEVPCDGHPDFQNRRCYWRVFTVDAPAILETLGLELQGW